MKLLFLANRTPYPPFRGDKLKIFNLAKQLRNLHEIHLITFAQSQEDVSYEDELKKVFHQVHQVYLPKSKSIQGTIKGFTNQVPFQVMYFQNQEMQAVLDQWLSREQYDAIHVQHIRMAPYLLGRKEIKNAILDLPDAFSLYWQRRKEFSKNFISKTFESIEQKRLLAYEKKVIAPYPLALVCSSEDQQYLLQTHGLHNVQVLPNGVDLSAFAAANHDYQKPNEILFTGNMDYAPNVDAVQYFVADILPEIIKAHPQVHFTIAGQRPVQKVLQLASDTVRVTGFIPNLADAYAAATLVVAPLRFGAGTQNKVLEAMAMGVPVVCTHVGFAGLGVESGVGVYKETETTAFAQRVIQLLQNENLRAQTGRSGQDALRKNFGWATIAQKLEAYLSQVKK